MNTGALLLVRTFHVRISHCTHTLEVMLLLLLPVKTFRETWQGKEAINHLLLNATAGEDKHFAASSFGTRHWAPIS